MDRSQTTTTGGAGFGGSFPVYDSFGFPVGFYDQFGYFYPFVF